MHFNSLTTAVIDSLAWMLIHSTWQICLIGIALFAFLKLANTKDHEFKYWSAVTALGLSSVGAISTFLYYFSTTETLVQEVTIITSSVTSQDLLLGQSQSASQLFTSIYDSIINHNDTIVLLWVLGAIVLFAKFCLNFISIYKIKKSLIPITNPVILDIGNKVQDKLGLKSSYNICSTTLSNSAAVIGWLKPIIIIPICMLTTLNERELELIIAHEMAHIKRYDFIINIFQNIIEIVLYYHPVVWWISNVINEQREICCDELAVKETDHQISYARTLLKLQELNISQSNSSLMKFGGKNNQFKNRILNILNQPINSDIKMERLIAFIGILTISLSFTTLSYTKDLIVELCNESTELNPFAKSDDSLTNLDVSTNSLVKTSSNQPSVSIPEILKLSPIFPDTIPVNNKRVIIIETQDEDGATVEQIVEKVKVALNEDEDIKIDTILDGDLIMYKSKSSKIAEKEHTKSKAKRLKIYSSDTGESIIMENGDDVNILDLNKILHESKVLETEAIENALANLDLDIDIQFDSIMNTVQVNMDDLQHEISILQHDLQNQQQVLIKKLNDNQNFLFEYDLDIDDWSTDDLAQEFEELLIEDGLITNSDTYTFEMKNKSLRFNGKQMPNSMLEKYKSYYETVAGAKFRKRSKVFINKNQEKRNSTFNNVKIVR